MKQEVALRVLGQVMDWDEDRARQEFSWLQLMARFKYDDYQDYMAGARFVECLADWLQQFKKEDRAVAYSFVRSKMIYFGAAEIQHMVDLVYPTLVERTLISAIARQCGVPAYLVWSTPEATRLYGELSRKCLFFGLSDGARIDVFRRANAGRISNEQVVLATEINETKWDSLLKDLRESLKDPDAHFKFVFLLDDFVATGTTLLRREGSAWKGRLPKFWDIIKGRLATHFDADLQVIVHHYIATARATKNGSVAESMGRIVGETPLPVEEAESGTVPRGMPAPASGTPSPNPWDLSLSRQNVCSTLKELERRIGLRRDATRAPIQGPEWQGAGFQSRPQNSNPRPRQAFAYCG